MPSPTLPSTHSITVYAARAIAFLNGRVELTLAADNNPTATIALKADTSARLGGIVVDKRGNPLTGVTIGIVGRESETATTDVH